MKRWMARLVLGIGAMSCADISLPERGICGNGVLEAGEDCDGRTDDRLGPNLACGSCAYTWGGGAQCPTGWHEDADHTCHHAIGELVSAPGSPFELASEEIAIGDVDGDGNRDVVAFAGDGLVVRFGAGDGSLDSIATHRFAAEPSGSIAVGDLSGDGLLDAAISTEFGLSVLFGRETRVTEPATYSPYFRPDDWEGFWFLPLRIAGVAPQHSYGLLWSDADQKFQLSLSMRDMLGEFGRATLGEPGLRTELLGTRIPVANLDSHLDTDELALAFEGETSVHVCKTHEFKALGCPPPACPSWDCDHSLDLPRGHRIVRKDGADGTARFADVDGDGEVDLLVHTEGNGSEHVLVALGNGTVDLAPLAVDSRFRGDWPVLAADLDGDRVADYVMADGVHLATGVDRGLVRVSAALQAETWVEAVSGDFDRDGEQDVFVAKALADGSSILELRRGGSGAPVFPVGPSWLLSGRAELLRVGDFDDDGVDDLAFVERVEDEGGDNLRVLWGSRDGAPRGADGGTEPDRIAAFQRVDHLETGNFRPQSGVLDRASDLVVVVSDPAPGIAIFAGSPLLRTLLSPFVLHDNNLPHRLGSAFAGDFVDDTIVPEDLLVFARTSDDAARPGLWLAPGAAGARFDVPQADRKATFLAFDPPPDPPFDDRCATFAVGDIDADDPNDPDELVGVDCGTSDRPSTLLVVRATADGVATCFVSLPDVRSPLDLALADLDGDERSDLVVAHESGVALLANVAALCPASGKPAPIEALATRAEGVESLSVIEIDADTTPELAILDESGIYFMELDAGGSRIARAPAVETAALAKRIRTADFDGDGLDDLLWSNGSQAGVLLAKSHRGVAAP